MTNEPTITLDAAQQIVIAALNSLREIEGRIGPGRRTIEDVENAGAGRHERLVAFDLVMPDGTRKTFIATITEEGA